MSDAQNVPKPEPAMQTHWWYNSSQAGVRNPPPPGMSGSPPISPNSDSGERRFSLTQMLVGSGSPAGATGAYHPHRRDSLKNMYHMSDFGTPDN